MALNKVKTALFFLVILLPSFLAAAIFFNIASNILRIDRGLDYGSMTADIAGYLSSDRSRAAASLEGGVMTVECEYTDPRSEYKGFVREVPFTPSSGDRLIYVYGSSPVISKPPFFIGRFRTFADILEEKLNAKGPGKSYKVFNFGMTSADSMSINKIVEATVKARKPDMLVYYYGGDMDYQAAYHIAGVKRQHYLLTLLPTEKLSAALSLEKFAWWRDVSRYGRWFNRTYLETYLLNFFQAAGLLRIGEEPFFAMNSMIEADVARNVAFLAAFARREGIPLVLVTNAVNLEAKPFGVYPVTQGYYEKGKKEKDFGQKVKYITKAIDSEIFSGDLRPKTGTYEAFYAVGREGIKGVHVFDFKEEIMRERTGFDYAYFYDYGHLKPEMHRVIADRLYRFLEEKGLI